MAEPPLSRSGRRPGRGRGRLRPAAGAAALLGAATLALAWHVGWGTRPPAWQEATGWSRIEASLRPGPPRTRFDLGHPGEPDPLRLHWLGHSGFLLEWRGVRLLLDPHTGTRCTVAPRRLAPTPRPADLGRVDAALVSHGHYDHLDLPTLEGVPGLGRVVLPAGSEAYVEPLAAGGTPVVGLAAGERLAIGALEVIAVPALHHGNRFHPLASRHAALGYVIRAGDRAVYFAGDTGYGPHLAAIGAAHHPRLAILPIGAYAPAFPIGRVHLSPEQAVAAALDLGAETVVPCHFGTFVLALDRAEAALPRFARAAHSAGVDWAMPRLIFRPISRSHAPTPAPTSAGSRR